MTGATITLVGGPTTLIELEGFRFVTDPTFDAPGDYPLPHVTLKKTANPVLSADQMGTVDAVLLSHDQHADNLDTSGRAFLVPVEIHRELITAAQAYIMAAKLGSVLSLRMAILLNSLSLQKKFSIRCRHS